MKNSQFSKKPCRRVDRRSSRKLVKKSCYFNVIWRNGRPPIKCQKALHHGRFCTGIDAYLHGYLHNSF